MTNMRYGEKTPDEMCNELELLHEVEFHDMAEIELWNIVSAISEAQEGLGDAVKECLFEATKLVLGGTPYDRPDSNGQFSTKEQLDGLLADPTTSFRAMISNLAISCSKTGELKRLLTGSGLTLQERTVIVLHYIHGKSEYESALMTGDADTGAILWSALVKIGRTLQRSKRR